MSFIIPAQITNNATRVLRQAEFYREDHGYSLPDAVMEAILDLLPEVYSTVPMPCPTSTPMAWQEWFEEWRPR